MPRISSFVTDAARRRHRVVYDRALAALPPHDVQRVETDYGEVQTLTFGGGSGTPVVLLHGLSCTSAMWRDNVRALAENRAVVAIDIISDCGGGKQTAPVTSLDDLVRSVSQTLDGLGIPRAHVVGLSYGAWVGAGLALQDPERLVSLSLLEPAGTLDRIRPAYVRGLLVSFLRRSARRWRFLFQRRPSDELIALLDASRGFRPRTPLPNVLSDEELAGIDVPAQVILGRRSTACHADRIRRRLADLPNGFLLHVVEDAGHVVSVDQPDVVNSMLVEFLRRCND